MGKPAQQFGLRAATFEAACPKPDLVGHQLGDSAFFDLVQHQERLSRIAAHHHWAAMDAGVDQAEPPPPGGFLVRRSCFRQLVGHRMTAADGRYVRLEGLVNDLARRVGRQYATERRAVQAYWSWRIRTDRLEESAAIATYLATFSRYASGIHRVGRSGRK